jgi:hypothetical protein
LLERPVAQDVAFDASDSWMAQIAAADQAATALKRLALDSIKGKELDDLPGPYERALWMLASAPMSHVAP